MGGGDVFRKKPFVFPFFYAKKVSSVPFVGAVLIFDGPEKALRSV